VGLVATSNNHIKHLQSIDFSNSDFVLAAFVRPILLRDLFQQRRF